MDSTLESEPRGSGLLGKCVLCGLPLPLRIPAVNEEGRDWRCAECGSTFYGVLLEHDSATGLRRNVEFVATESSSRNNLAAAGFKPKGTAKTAPSASIKTRCPVHTPVPSAQPSISKS